MAGKNTPSGTRKPPGKGKGGRAMALMPAAKQGAATLTGAGLATVGAEIADNAMGAPKADETTKRQIITAGIAAAVGTGAAFAASKIKATRKFAAAILGGTALAVAARVAPSLKELGRMIADKFKKAPEGEPKGSEGIGAQRGLEVSDGNRIRDLVN